MHEPIPALHLRARLSLLLAALLYFSGAVAGGTLHSHTPPPAGVVAFSAPEKHSGELPVPYGEAGCFICQILGGSGLPAAALPLAASPERLVPAPILKVADLPRLDSAPPQARAPPAPRSA